MYLPKLNAIQQGAIVQQQFYGLNRRARIGDGQMEYDENLSAEHFPVLAGRRRRKKLTADGDLGGMIVKDSAVWTDGADVYVNGVKSTAVTVSTLTGPKQLVGMGAKVIIWPDKVWVDTLDTTQGGYLEQENTVTGGTVSFKPCMADGTEYDLSDAYLGDTPPVDPQDGDWWIDTGSVPHGLYRYAAGTGEWTGISANYIRIGASGIGAGLNVYDGITISGISIDDVDVKEQLEGLNGAGHPVYGAGTDYVIVAGILDKAISATQTITIGRYVPDFDYICEMDNRLWGCRYRIGEEGEVVNEIGASALGDPAVWDRYMGNSTDSYRVSVGSDGVFTAIASHMGNILAWKEDCLHRIWGSGPSSFQLATIICEGVQKDCWLSMANVNGVLYYKGRTAVWAYDGSLPQNVGKELGEHYYPQAAGGTIDGVYYLSMETKDETWETYTYDTQRGAWHLDSRDRMAYFGKYIGTLAAIVYGSSSSAVWDILGKDSSNENAPVEPAFTWTARFGPTGYQYTDRKYLSRYNIRCTVPEGQRIRVLMQYDSEGPWIEMANVEGHGKTNTIMIPVRPRRCDHCRLEIQGGYGVKVYSVARMLEVGGDG